MSDLVQFLRARLDEDERIAQECASNVEQKLAGGTPMIVITGYTIRDHYHQFNPARVLAEAEAKRRIIDDAVAEPHYVGDGLYYTCPAATQEHDGGVNPRHDNWVITGEDLACDCGRDERVERRLRLLALPYADRPDCRPEWRLDN